jgi:hypothetical protein
MARRRREEEKLSPLMTYVPPRYIEQLRKRALANKRSMSAEAAIALERYLDEHP